MLKDWNVVVHRAPDGMVEVEYTPTWPTHALQTLKFWSVDIQSFFKALVCGQDLVARAHTVEGMVLFVNCYFELPWLCQFSLREECLLHMAVKVVLFLVIYFFVSSLQQLLWDSLTISFTIIYTFILILLLKYFYSSIHEILVHCSCQKLHDNKYKLAAFMSGAPILFWKLFLQLMNSATKKRNLSSFSHSVSCSLEVYLWT